MMQKTMTTVVDPIVSARVGNDTFFSSPRTSLRNSRIESINFLNMLTSYSLFERGELCIPSSYPTFPPATDLLSIRPSVLSLILRYAAFGRGTRI